MIQDKSQPHFYETVFDTLSAGDHVTDYEVKHTLKAVQKAIKSMRAFGPEFDLALHRLIHFQIALEDIISLRKIWG